MCNELGERHWVEAIHGGLKIREIVEIERGVNIGIVRQALSTALRTLLSSSAVVE